MKTKKLKKIRKSLDELQHLTANNSMLLQQLVDCLSKNQQTQRTDQCQ